MSDVDLPIVWAGVIVFTIFAYVTMDGFDLGIGILFLRFRSKDERDRVMRSIIPFWDGNETWLVLGGGALMSAFPAAYSIILPATYPLVIAMLLGLVLRGVAFEFRWQDGTRDRWWDRAFALGSLMAAMAQGMILGTIVHGIRVRNSLYAGGLMDWLTPFSLLTGVSLVMAYALLGSTWLIWRTEGGVQDQARRLALYLGIATLAAIVAVSVATPFLDQQYWQRWFDMPSVLFTAQVPVLTALVACAFFWSLRCGRDRLAFLLSLMLFILSFVGLGISVYPNLIPPAVTIWEAASPPQSLRFTLVGFGFILPIIVAYSSWSYWVFRGKTSSAVTNY